MHRTLGTALLLALSLGPFAEALAEQSTRSTPEPPPLLSPAEFPPYDAAVWRQQHGGLGAKVASTRLAEHPESPEIADLLQQGRIDDVLRVLGAIVDNHPDRIARAFEIVGQQSYRFDDRGHGYADALQQIIDAARKRLPDLPREEAARAARQLLQNDRQPRPAGLSFVDRLRAFVEQYSGTETALLTEIDVITSGLRIHERLAALDEFVRSRPGTLAAAKALSQKGFQLGSGNVYPDYEARGADPTDRFFLVLDIVKELESGIYPSSEWVDRAPALVTYFFAYNPNYAPGNIDRQIEGYTAFVKSHFELDQLAPARDGTGYIVTTKIGDLFKLKGERTAGVERVLMELERDIPDVSAVRYLRAAFYVSQTYESEAERPAFYQKAIGALRTLAAQGNGHYHRKALATLASLYFSERDYVNARDCFRQYLTAYPNTEWAWIAALRVGQSEEAMGEWTRAAGAYAAAAATYSSVPMARVLSRAYAAGAHDALSQFERALVEYEAALAGWDKDYGLVYSLPASHPLRAGEQFSPPDDPGISRQDIADRVAQLRFSLGAPGGPLLERGRWLVARGQHQEARAPLERLLKQYPRSATVPEGRYSLNKARLAAALELAAIDNRRPDEPAALAELDAVMRGPYDFGVFAAKVAKVSIGWRQGPTPEAESTMRNALTELFNHQSRQRESPRQALEEDIAGIRNAVVRPRGDGLFGGWAAQGFNGRQSAHFIIVNPDLTVKLAGGEVTRASVYQSLAERGPVIFLNAEQQALLRAVVTRLGGRPTPEAAAGILNLWDTIIRTEPWWGGVGFESYPIISDIEFLNSERTRALARIRVGHEGATVVLEKDRDMWNATRLVNRWIS